MVVMNCFAICYGLFYYNGYNYGATFWFFSAFVPPCSAL